MPKPRGLSQQQMRSWALINDMAQDFGAWVVSEPNKNPIRLECVDAALPVHLSRLGYDVTQTGTSERLVPVPGGCGPGTVFCFQVELPFGPQATSEIPR